MTTENAERKWQQEKSVKMHDNRRSVKGVKYNTAEVSGRCTVYVFSGSPVASFPKKPGLTNFANGDNCRRLDCYSYPLSPCTSYENFSMSG